MDDGQASVKPYRTELSPLTFLRRSAYLLPDQVAIANDERRTTHRELDGRLPDDVSGSGSVRSNRPETALHFEPQAIVRLAFRFRSDVREPASGELDSWHCA